MDNNTPLEQSLNLEQEAKRMLKLAEKLYDDIVIELREAKLRLDRATELVIYLRTTAEGV